MVRFEGAYMKLVELVITYAWVTMSEYEILFTEFGQ